MTVSINQVLGGENLTGVIQGKVPGLPEDVLPPGLISPATRTTVRGDSVRAIRVDGNQKTARQALKGSPSRARTLKGVSQVPVVLIHSAEHVEMPFEKYENLRTPDGQVDEKGQREVARQVAECRQYSMNLRVAAVLSAFGNGKVWFDADGNLLGSSSGASVTVDYNIPSGNQSTLNWDGNGAIIDASWATNTTKIVTHMQKIHKAARRLTGYRLRHALYGENILDYLLTNTQVKELINRNAGMQAAAGAGEIPDGLFGLRWWPGYQGFFLDNSDAYQQPIGADEIVFMPEPDPTWFEWFDGTQLIPSSFSIAGSAEDAFRDATQVAGMFSYAVRMDDPLGVKMVYGDNFLPWIRVPKAVFIADTTP